MICKKCGGSGTLLKPEPKKSISKSFVTCSDCEGKGTSQAPLGPKTVVMHNMKRFSQFEKEDPKNE